MKGSPLFFIVVVFYWFGQTIYFSFLPPYLAEAGVSATLIGLVTGVFGVSQMILRIPLSIASWKGGSHRMIMASGIAVVFISCLIPMFSESWIAFFCARVFVGIAAATWISFSAYVLEGAGEDAGKRMGYLIAAMNGGICIAQLIGTLAYEYIGMRGLYIIGMAVSAAAFCLLYAMPVLYKDPAVNGRQFRFSEYRPIIKNRNIWVCALLMGFCYILQLSTGTSFSGVFAQEEMNATFFHIGLIVFIGRLSATVVSAAYGKLSKAGLSDKTALILGFAIYAVYCFASPHINSIPLFIIWQILFGVATGLAYVASYSNAGRDFSDEQQIFAMALFQTAFCYGMISGPVITGYVLDVARGTYFLPFYTLTGISLLGVVFSAILFRERESFGGIVDSKVIQ